MFHIPLIHIVYGESEMVLSHVGRIHSLRLIGTHYPPMIEVTKTYQIAEQLILLNKEDPEYPQKRMELMVRYLQRYIETYGKRPGYKNYSDKTFIDDILYGLGVALNPEEHQYAFGYDRWKEKLIEFLK